MLGYIIRRLLLIIPTLLGIMLISFIIIQATPGGPIENVISRMQGFEQGADSRLSSQNQDFVKRNNNVNQSSQTANKYRGAQGLDPALIKRLEKMYGFDKPAYERFFLMLKNYLMFDFGESFFKNAKVTDLIISKMPVSISLGLWSTLIIYLVCIPLGIKKAVSHGSRFDVSTSAMIIVGYAIPGFLFAILLIILFASGTFWQIFPLRGLTSDNFAELSTWGKVTDYFWHVSLPVIAMSIGGFATLTMLTKNSFLDEINKQYVVTARAKGLTENRILYHHVFRNAMLLIIAGFPATLISVFFTGSLLIEVIFSLDGLGLLSFESALNRDYPVIFATLYIFSLMGLLIKLISDLTYTLVDPRIDFESRDN